MDLQHGSVYEVSHEVISAMFRPYKYIYEPSVCVTDEADTIIKEIKC